MPRTLSERRATAPVGVRTPAPAAAELEHHTGAKAGRRAWAEGPLADLDQGCSPKAARNVVSRSLSHGVPLS